MKISEFAELVAIQEEGKQQVNIAQIKEILKVINRIFTFEGEDFYKTIRRFKP